MIFPFLIPSPSETSNYLDLDLDVYAHECIQVALTLAAVSSRWRDYAITFPFLWTDLCFTKWNTLRGFDVANMFLARSTETPLSVSVHSMSPERLPELDKLLFSQRHRIKKIRFNICLDQLERLRLEFPRPNVMVDMEERVAYPLDFDEVSNHRPLPVNLVQPVFLKVPYPVFPIQNIDLTALTRFYTSAISLEELSKFFDFAPNLLSCTAKIAPGSSHPDASCLLVHKCLHELRLTFKSGSRQYPSVDLSGVPSLRRLFFESPTRTQRVSGVGQLTELGITDVIHHGTSIASLSSSLRCLVIPEARMLDLFRPVCSGLMSRVEHVVLRTVWQVGAPVIASGDVALDDKISELLTSLDVDRDDYPSFDFNVPHLNDYALWDHELAQKLRTEHQHHLITVNNAQPKFIDFVTGFPPSWKQY